MIISNKGELLQFLKCFTDEIELIFIADSGMNYRLEIGYRTNMNHEGQITISKGIAKEEKWIIQWLTPQ